MAIFQNSLYPKIITLIKPLLLITGFFLLVFQQYIYPIPVQVQFFLFLTGIILLGVPHGAADLLIATKHAGDEHIKFSSTKFFINYLSRLMLFAVILYFLPLLGNLLFIFFAAYHFGETDLNQFKTNSLPGKLFVVSYGLVILGVILLNHFEEVKPLLMQFNAGVQHTDFINWIDQHRYIILSAFGLLFFTSTFIYFAVNTNNQQHLQGQFLVQFALIIFILYKLPMILGFTFYFVVWHSLLSLRNIVGYLRKDGLFSFVQITRQIGLYSVLAIAGTVLFGLTGIMFINNDAIIVYVFLGLAVLTAPHMQIMHDMYNSIRIKSSAAAAASQ